MRGDTYGREPKCRNIDLRYSISAAVKCKIQTVRQLADQIGRC